MNSQLKNPLGTVLLGTSLAIASSLSIAEPAQNASEQAKNRTAILAYWNADRIASAEPRDLVVDNKGHWYLRGRNNKLTPYGQGKMRPAPTEKPTNPGGGNGGGKPGNEDDSQSTVKNAEWTGGGAVQNAAGRIYFVMGGVAYVCSGTAVDDGSPGGRSLVLTAAHCVYDDLAKEFASYAIFIPNQSESGTRTDNDCSNDVHGCWVADFGVVSTDWAGREWPDNIPADYAFYVVTTGGTSGTHLDDTQGIEPMAITFRSAAEVEQGADSNIYTHALGYSYSQDPNFMYCAEPVRHSSYGGWLLSSCGLSGGASGGPWTQSQDADLGVGPLISVNSYGPSRGKSYMGGPYLYGNDAECLFDQAKQADLGPTGGGYVISVCPGP